MNSKIWILEGYCKEDRHECRGLILSHSSNKLWTVGRQNADIIIQDKSISRMHASIQIEDNGGLYLIDSSSKFGSFVNTKRITGSTALIDGDELCFGASSRSFRICMILFRPYLGALSSLTSKQTCTRIASAGFDVVADFRPEQSITVVLDVLEQGPSLAKILSSASTNTRFLSVTKLDDILDGHCTFGRDDDDFANIPVSSQFKRTTNSSKFTFSIGEGWPKAVSLIIQRLVAALNNSNNDGAFSVNIVPNPKPSNSDQLSIDDFFMGIETEFSLLAKILTSNTLKLDPLVSPAIQPLMMVDTNNHKEANDNNRSINDDSAVNAGPSLMVLEISASLFRKRDANPTRGNRNPSNHVVNFKRFNKVQPRKRMPDIVNLINADKGLPLQFKDLSSSTPSAANIKPTTPIHPSRVPLIDTTAVLNIGAERRKKEDDSFPDKNKRFQSTLFNKIV